MFKTLPMCVLNVFKSKPCIRLTIVFILQSIEYTCVHIHTPMGKTLELTDRMDMVAVCCMRQQLCLAIIAKRDIQQ